jgi:hypothetical protein
MELIPDRKRKQQMFDIYRSCIRSFELLMMDGDEMEFCASSWRSNQGYTKMHGQPIIKIGLINLAM